MRVLFGTLFYRVKFIDNEFFNKFLNYFGKSEDKTHIYK